MMAPRRLGQVALAVVCTLAAIVLLARATAMSLPYHPSDAARLRVSWSARPERIEICRTLSEAELAQRPEHMRQRVECDGKFASYRLMVEVDGRREADVVVYGGGLRRDRPMHLLEEFDVPPGAHRVRVSFERREAAADSVATVANDAVSGADTGIFAGRAQRETVERTRRAGAAIPPRLVLDTSLVLAPRAVTLVTFNAERRALQMLGALAVSAQP